MARWLVVAMPLVAKVRRPGLARAKATRSPQLRCGLSAFTATPYIQPHRRRTWV